MKAILSLITGFFTKFKLYLYGLIVLILIAGFFTIKYLVKENQKYRSDNYRLETNQLQILSDATQQTELYLKQKEVTGKIKRERDSLALIVKVKPKQVTKIVVIDNSIHDTVRVDVPVNIIGKNEWKIRDSTKCLKIVYNAKLIGDSLFVKRELLEYDNNPVQIFYRERPHKFLFIKFGKWQYKQVTKTKCEEPKTEIINFTK
jgi:hypothetical protein